VVFIIKADCDLSDMRPKIQLAVLGVNYCKYPQFTIFRRVQVIDND